MRDVQLEARASRILTINLLLYFSTEYIYALISSLENRINALFAEFATKS